MALKAEMPFQPLWRVKETGSQLTVRNQIRALQQFNQMPDRVSGWVDVRLSHRLEDLLVDCFLSPAVSPSLSGPGGFDHPSLAFQPLGPDPPPF